MDCCHRLWCWVKTSSIAYFGPTQAFAGELDAMSVVDETVQNGVGVGRIADDFVPTVDRTLGGDHRGAASVTLALRRFPADHGARLRRAAQAPSRRGSKGRLGRGCVRCGDDARRRGPARGPQTDGEPADRGPTDCRDRLCGQALRPANFCQRRSARREPNCHGR